MRDLRAFKMHVAAQLPVQTMVLFGSRATGKTRKWSDVDLLIVSDKFRRLTFRKRATKMYDYWDLDYPVDFLCYTPEEFRRLRRQRTLVADAVKHGVEI